MKCNQCLFDILSHLRNCPECQADVGFPNVRAASQEGEVGTLEHRVAAARVSTAARACNTVLEDFGRAVNKSKAVICRSLSALHAFCQSDNALYATFYGQVQGESRLPENNVWDHGRPAVDGTLFPYYEREIRFAALSLDDRGVGGDYGPYSITLRTERIEHRATVFEENPFAFCRRHAVTAGSSLPAGYRATWAKRGDLAMSKLHSELSASTTPDHYARILLRHYPDSDDDFIEVHIFGSFSRRAIEKVVGPKPANGPDAVLWRSLQSALGAIGIPLEVG